MLKTEFLPASTRAVFERLRGDALLKQFTLVGGSALALQIGHRISEDLDFNVFGEKLPRNQLARLLEKLESEGMTVNSLIPHEHKVQFRINTGEHLDDAIQDYVIAGSKVTFHARYGVDYPNRQIEFLETTSRVDWSQGAGFAIMGLDGLFVMKTLVLFDRARSRDIFDLAVLMREHGYGMAEMERAATQYLPASNRDFERCKSVLTGLVALDANDEGFEGIGLDTEVTELYAYFESMVAEYEASLSRNMKREKEW